MQRIEFAQPPRAMPLIFHHRQPPFATNNDALEKVSVCVCVCQTTAVEVAEKKKTEENISLKASPALCRNPRSFVLDGNIALLEPRTKGAAPYRHPCH